MDQSCQGKGSTKTASSAAIPPPFPPNSEPIDTMEPLPQEPFNTCTHFVFITIIEISGMLFSNQLGRFPITSNRGNKYDVIFYIHNANFVKISPNQEPIEGRAPAGLLVGLCLSYSMGLQTATSQDVQQHVL